MPIQTLAPPPPDRIPLEHNPHPTFSIVLAAFEAANTIGEALESVFSQTFPPYEVIVCDDGSTDALDEALAPYLDRIALIRKERGGFASATNAAIRVASGEFVVLLGCDDVFHSGRLEALSELARARPDLDILTTDAYVDAGGRSPDRFYSQETRFHVSDQRSAILESCFIFGHVALRRKRVVEVGGLDESIVSSSDWELIIRLILDGARAGLVNEPLSTYRLREGSITSSRVRMLRGRCMTLRKTLARTDLSENERSIVQRGILEQERELDLEEARLSLREGRPDTRRLAWKVARDPGQHLTSRARAVLALLAPRAAARRLQSKERKASHNPAYARSRRQ